MKYQEISDAYTRLALAHEKEAALVFSEHVKEHHELIAKSYRLDAELYKELNISYMRDLEGSERIRQIKSRRIGGWRYHLSRSLANIKRICGLS